MQDWLTVCTEHTISLEIVLDAPDGIPRYVDHVESRFSPFRDGVSVSAL
jgi:hypothetical protein